MVAMPVVGQVKVADSIRISLEEVDITAARIPEKTRQSARINRIITRKEIELSPARDLAGILESIPDIDVRQRGPGGVQADISFRGGTFDQTAVLINGVNFTDPQTGHFQLDIPIPLSLIQRIEVLSGSDVKSLGSNAFAGAINIVTGVPEKKRVHALLIGGQHGLLEAGIDAANRSGRWYQLSGVGYQVSDGYRENTDFKNLTGCFQIGYNHKRLDISILAAGLKKAFGANSFYSIKYPNQFEQTGSGFTTLQAYLQGKVNFRQSVYYKLHTDEFALFRSNPPSWYIAPNYHLTQVAGSKTDAWFSSSLGKTAFGIEYRRESIWSTVLGNLSENTKRISGVDLVEYNHFGVRDHFSLSAEHQLITGKVKWNGGVVLHDVRAAKNYFQVYPGLDISYTASSTWRSFFSFNRAFRLPTFTELYYKSPTNQGNAQLLPETAWNAETGAEYHSGGFSGKLLGFYRFATQSIDWVRAVDETIWHAENLGRIRTWGIETGLTWSPVKTFGIAKSIEHFDFGYRYYFQHHQVENWFSQYVLDYLKWKMTAGLSVKIGEPFHLSASLVWQERNGTYTSFDQLQNMIEVDYKPFTTVDIKLSYKLKWITFIAECSNLLNQAYFDLGGVPQPGTWLKAGFELNLEGRN